MNYHYKNKMISQPSWFHKGNPYTWKGSLYGLVQDCSNPEMCSERDSPLEPFVLLAPGQPELARLICGAHLGPPVLTRKQKRPRVNSLVCDRVAAFSVAGPPEVLSRMSPRSRRPPSVNES